VYLAANDCANAARVDVEALTTIYEAKYKLPFYAELGACHAKLGNRAKALASYEKFVATYKTVDTDAQAYYAGLYKRVLAEQQQLEASGSGSTQPPGAGPN
jgi:tetratricopeptide (TPR) repeat protein